jgi:hypothetical protein
MPMVTIRRFGRRPKRRPRQRMGGNIRRTEGEGRGGERRGGGDAGDGD